MKEGLLTVENDVGSAIVDLVRSSLSSGAAGSVLIPSKGPENTFQWMLVSDVPSLEKVEPLPPVMSVQGARALASCAQSPVEGTLLAVMRPCEARAAIELSKLEQIDLDGIVLLTMDCPGVVPLSKYTEDSATVPDFDNPETVRPLCRQCTEFTSAGDICMVSMNDGNTPVPLTDKGHEYLHSLGLKAEDDISAWENRVAALKRKREEFRTEADSNLSEAFGGLSGMTEVFSGCISCRSCRTVCPVCYCRLCFIDMKDRRSPASAYLDRSRSAGATRLLSDTLLFHIGRMAHMSLSCVSCGMCEDSCPSDIPIGRLVSMVSRSTTALFDYSAGRNPEDPLPLNTFQLEELHEFED
jgi:formate dehydrogenase (coenzyme F420) beta subunit